MIVTVEGKLLTIIGLLYEKNIFIFIFSFDGAKIWLQSGGKV